MHTRTGLLTAAVTILLATLSNTVPALSFVSPETRVSTVELFTSHGCSSCPPADAWLRKFTANPGLWQTIIPLSFHVDYWDKLGWPDPFARSEFTLRQMAYQASGGLPSTYTPGIVVDGREWRPWPKGWNLTTKPGPVVGRLSMETIDTDQVIIRFERASTGSATTMTAHLVVLGFGISTPVHGGENRGKKLQEDFVVLGYRSSANIDARTQWQLALPDLAPAATSKRAIVAWVSAGADPTPVQTVGGWLPANHSDPRKK